MISSTKKTVLLSSGLKLRRMQHSRTWEPAGRHSRGRRAEPGLAADLADRAMGVAVVPVVAAVLAVVGAVAVLVVAGVAAVVVETAAGECSEFLVLR
jgi:hypothetical protein